MRCFHGTTLKMALEIINGSQEKSCGVWACSDSDNAFYVYPIDKHFNEFGYDWEDDSEDESIFDEVRGRVISEAAQHGQMALCTVGTDENIFAVLEMDIPDELLQDDFSCDGMNGIASFIDSEDMNKIKFISVHTAELSVYHRPFVIAPLIGNQEFTDSEIDNALLTMAELVKGGEFCHIYEDLREIELTEHKPEDF